ncbi:MAG: DUF3788 family protein [Ignavibacteria bacterium]|nr:DUF3788 family protein [Ignavibacteria bacterium]
MVDEKLPFNNFKHIPSRPEIDTVLGMLPALELKRFEEQLDLLDSTISWAFQWYENLEGWGYRASFKQRVLCILHFDRGYFSATLSIPLAMEYKYLALKELTPNMREHFKDYRLSQKMKWVSLHVKNRADTDSLLAIIRLKLEDLRQKTAGGKK